MRRSARIGGLAAAFVTAALAVAPAAPGHVPRAGRPGDAGIPGMSERRLREFESAVLGPDHAAEHARKRSLIRAGAVPRAPAPALRADPPAALGGRWKSPF